MFVCCMEHAEIAIEEFVNQFEEAPDIYQLKETHFSDWDPPQSCEWCEHSPVLLLVQVRKGVTDQLNVTIIAVGKLKEAYLVAAIKEYSKRISAYAQLRMVEVPDEPCPENASETMEISVMAKEAAKILFHIKERDYVIALSIAGKSLDSVQFAEFLDRTSTQGSSSFVFVIGGSLGLHPLVLARSNYQLSFSKMTFPHQLMRVFLIEQIYRAFKIQRGEKYHK